MWYRRRKSRIGKGRIAQRLLARLIKEEGVPEGSTVCRVYAGYWQRSEGAWSWECVDPKGYQLCGSQLSMREMLTADAKKWDEWLR